MSLKPKIYPTLNDVVKNYQRNPNDCIFDNCHLFDGTMQYEKYVTVTDANGGRSRVATQALLPNLLFDPDDLEEYFIHYFGEKQLCKELLPDDNFKIPQTSWSVLWHWMQTRIKLTWKANVDKYIRLVASLDLSYDPISNYDMMETGKDMGNKGEFSTERTGNNSVETTNTGVIPNAKLTIGGADGDISVVGVDWSNTGDKVTTEADNTNKPTTINSVTTYDSDTPVTLNKSENTGKTTSTTNQDDKFSTTSVRGARGWKDTTKTVTPSDDYHNLNRQGNIGVTTTQEMIEKERQVARYSVIEEFMNDMKHEVMLSTWR